MRSEERAKKLVTPSVVATAFYHGLAIFRLFIVILVVYFCISSFMRIVYAARNPRPEFERETGAARVELPRLLKESDVLSLHVPAVPETKGIINSDTLRQMKPTAILVNTARGDLIREEALALALEEGRLGAAGLDVYADEPHIHPRLVAAPRIVLMPHIGSATPETRREMARIAVANVQAVLGGGPPLTPVFG